MAVGLVVLGYDLRRLQAEASAVVAPTNYHHAASRSRYGPSRYVLGRHSSRLTGTVIAFATSRDVGVTL